MMVNENEIRQLFSDYINGLCDSEELKKVFSLLATPEGELIYRELIENEDEAGLNESIGHASKEDLFRRILVSADMEKKKKKKTKFHINALKYAATIVLLVTTSIIVYLQSGKTGLGSFNPSQKEIVNLANQRTKIILPDGTRVWLNQNSSLFFPEEFHGKTRDVILFGEAYFEVATDIRKPFCIESGGLRTIVLGTSFNIKNYKEHREATISLLTGKIKVESADSETNLTPGMELVYNKEDRKNVIKDFDPEEITAWVEGKIILKNTRLDSALIKISEWYDTPILLLNPVDDQCRVTSTYRQQDLGSVLSALSYSMDFQYKSKNDTIWINNGDCQ